MVQDLVSIILPCYKAEIYISTMIECVLSQTYKNWELIIVSNGADQERQLQIARSYKAKDSRIKIIEVGEGGVSNARNIGLKYAKGDWVTFVDADDKISYDHLTKYVNGITEGVEIVYAGYSMSRINEKSDLVFSLSAKQSDTEGLHFVIDYLLSVWDNILDSPCNKLYLMSFLRKINIAFDTRITYCEDRIFNLSIIKYCSRINTIEMSGYNYIVRGMGATSRYHESFDMALDKCLELENEVKRRLGYTEDQIKTLIVKSLYIRTYFKIINLYKKGCPFTLSEKIKRIRQYMSNKEFYESYKMQNQKNHNLLLQIYDVLLRTKSAFVMGGSLYMLYGIKSFLGEYSGIIIRLLRH